MSKKFIYLLRHGDIGLSKEKRYISQTDLPLSVLGLQQASILQEKLSRVPFDSIYCSDLARAQQTADIIGLVHQIKPIVRRELREIRMGDWEGQLFSEIRTKYPKEFRERGEDITNYSPPRGESFSDCYQRVIPVLKNLPKSNETTIAIVGHAGVNRVILCHVLGMPLENLFRFEQSYGCVNLISKEGSEYRLNYLNYMLSPESL
ncbi:alpha-ribazole phosphatase [Desulfosporosinus hippei]|uniref:Alpha-ribazole phosphatase n=1 Tax=Desulfosporosinus hippei DSM 8344 TaxID=1121419 RepID=A0A1G8BSU0_9FIRM|nr:alpha-ribazole phosphatase [Desulfosporosinus hippei]SDH36336.1 probable phosphoglycerate mutase [Desulfosporosinus hippei DSM 8344]